MKKLATLISLVAGSSLLAAGEWIENVKITHTPDVVNYHCITPKYFYRTQKEENCCYHVNCIGVEYNLERSQGINIRIDWMSNFKNQKSFVESSWMIGYRFPMSDARTGFYPFYLSRQVTHERRPQEEYNVYAYKSTNYFGIGWDWRLLDDAVCSIEGYFSKDGDNSLYLSTEDEFHGNTFSNPWGWGIRTGVKIPFSDSIKLDIHSFFNKTCKHCYRQWGIESGVQIKF